jgi:hypothetical protein
MYFPRTYDERRIILVLMAVSGIILVAIAILYALNPRDVVGDALVNNLNGTPAEFPPPSISPFYVKPVTIMYVALVVFAFCFFSIVQKWLSNLSRGVRVFFLIAFFVVLAVSAYETFFNFVLWGSLLVTHPNPDTVTNAYPVSSYRINLVFATKSFVALFFIALMGYLTLKKSLENEQV